MGMSMLTEHPCPAVCWSFEPGSKVPSTLGQGVHLCLRAEPCLQGNSVQVTFESYVFLFEKGSQVALAGLELVLRIHSVSLRRALDGTHSCFVDAQHTFYKLSFKPCVLCSMCMPPHACGVRRVSPTMWILQFTLGVALWQGLLAAELLPLLTSL